MKPRNQGSVEGSVDWEQARERLAWAARPQTDHRFDAARIEAAYRERAAALARPAAAPAPLAERRIVVFRLGEDSYAAPLSAVERIIPDPVCTPLPGPAGNWAGVMIADGAIVPVLHLARALGLAGAESPAGAHALKLRPIGIDCALLVGEVLEIRSFPAAALQPFSGSVPWVEGVAPGEALVLVLESLVGQELSQ